MMGVLGFAVSGVAVAGVNDKPPSPPGQDECEHGNTAKPCKEDPQPDKGKDCEAHGNNGGVNEDHCKGDETTPTETTPTTPTETTPTETTTTTATDSTPTETTPNETTPQVTSRPAAEATRRATADQVERTEPAQATAELARVRRRRLPLAAAKPPEAGGSKEAGCSARRDGRRAEAHTAGAASAAHSVNAKNRARTRHSTCLGCGRGILRSHRDGGGRRT